MAAITNGAELVSKLRGSGTGKDKLDPAVELLDRTNGKATAGDVVKHLADRFGDQHVTVEKARQFAASGVYIAGLKDAAPPPEEKFLPQKPKTDEAKAAEKDEGKGEGKAATTADPATAQMTVGPTVGPAPVKPADVKPAGGTTPAPAAKPAAAKSAA